MDISNKYKNILITGGAGFVGSNLAIKLKKDFPRVRVLSLDNLKRRGSELTLSRLREHGIEFLHGDIRNKEDLCLQDIDLIIECSAEPSVLAGINSSPDYLLNTNLFGTANCLELARKNKADFVFLSTSRVYPIEYLNGLNYRESETRFVLSEQQPLTGASEKGISEDFPLDKPRSLYGATKLASELLVMEYADTYGISTVVNRCGIITGPWQMGKIDQGVFVLWVAKHYFKGELSYIGFGGTGKQVRDFLHIDDLYSVIKTQLVNFPSYKGNTFNIGGGVEKSVSLLELTHVCQEVTGNSVRITPISQTRPADIPIYISDATKFLDLSKIAFYKDLQNTIHDIYLWIKDNERILKPILS